MSLFCLSYVKPSTHAMGIQDMQQLLIVFLLEENVILYTHN
jgi:hypothetical protein